MIFPVKKYILFFVFIYSALAIKAQMRNDLSPFQAQMLEKADNYFLAEEYYNAILDYQKVLNRNETDTSTILKIAECYFLMNNYDESEIWYRKVMNTLDSTNIDAHHYFNFAQILTINSYYPEALEWYKNYYFLNNSDPRAIAGIKTLENLNQLYFDTTFYTIYPLDLNTVYSEFSPIEYNNGIVFVSDRNKAKAKESGVAKKVNYTKWYFAETNNSENTGNCTEFIKGKNIDADFNLGSLVLFDNNQKMIFSKNTKISNKSKEQTIVYPIQLFSASKNEKDAWSKPQKLDFCDVRYSYGQPAISSDGSYLIFSSDLPGGFGGTDLYISRYENGIWLTPENLGEKINTKGNEMFPYILEDSILYFSSDGHGGLGGLDICYVSLQQEGDPERFGVPVNSSGDDFGIIFSDDRMSGYFSSNRKGSVGSDDIYGFKKIRIVIELKIIDQNTATPVANADVLIVTENGEKIIGKTDGEGNCELIVPVDQDVKIRVDKEDYESQIFTIEPKEYQVKSAAILFAENVKSFEEENPVNEENSVTEEKLVYKVQVAADVTPLSDKRLYRKYKGDMQVTMSYEDGWYKYTIGEFDTYEEARECLYKSNVLDAFVPVYRKDKRVKILLPRSISTQSK